MLLIPCPHCGPRPENEFDYGGQADVSYPTDPSSLADEEWAHFVFYRANPKGPLAERWVHAAGCRRWFTTVRDTGTGRWRDADAAEPESRPGPGMAQPAAVGSAAVGSTVGRTTMGKAPTPNPGRVR